jgi:hypothetical protein
VERGSEANVEAWLAGILERGLTQGLVLAFGSCILSIEYIAHLLSHMKCFTSLSEKYVLLITRQE